VEAAPFFSDVDDGPEGGRALWVTAADGVRIRVGAWPADGARGTVLLFPGRTEYIEKYGRAARDLAARGYATAAVDWRGQGIADRLVKAPLKGHVGAFSDYQLDVQAMRAAVAEMGLPRPFFLIGHSMGGCIGLRALHEGLPVDAAAFTGPMWGIAIPPAMRPVARVLSSVGTALGFGNAYAPGTVRNAYVLVEPFEGNNLTKDRGMYDYMIRQIRAHMDVALAGPTLRWLREALAETAALASMPAPDVPCIAFVGSDEAIVDVPAIEAQMAKWPGGRLVRVQAGDHEVMMDTPETRARLFDAITAHFDAHNAARRTTAARA
jgi:lysophospholipase